VVALGRVAADLICWPPLDAIKANAMNPKVLYVLHGITIALLLLVLTNIIVDNYREGQRELRSLIYGDDSKCQQ
jgi:hypothetical protein